MRKCERNQPARRTDKGNWGRLPVFFCRRVISKKRRDGFVLWLRFEENVSLHKQSVSEMTTLPFQILAATKLNPVQLHLLELFSKNMTERELLEIKDLLVKYYQQKIDEELDEIWEARGYSPESFSAATKNLHLRRKTQPIVCRFASTPTV